MSVPSKVNKVKNEQEAGGTWIGIDLGTSNCAAAVWDSTRGRPKVLQLGPSATRWNNKEGRILPSIVVVLRRSTDGTLEAVVGEAALQRHDNLASATITSVKRLLGVVDASDPLLKSLPMDLTFSSSNQVWINIKPAKDETDAKTTIQVTPVQILALLLAEIKHQAERYLAKNIKKKKMIIPGQSSVVSNAVIGIPAYFSSQQRQYVKEACHMADFTGSIHTIIESTAASMAYGLFVSVGTKQKIIMVLDIGGGTTDITITRLTPDKEWEVVTTMGDRQLGGDDMDIALSHVVLKKLDSANHSINPDRATMLQKCRKAKEDLCGTEDIKPLSTVTIHFDNHSAITLTKDEMDTALLPWITKCRLLIHKAIQQSNVDEIVLVGGGTRVPAVRTMVQDFLRNGNDVCTSLSADTAVAQGAAIQAAILSETVPFSDIQSCMMLDALPHAIGVKVNGNGVNGDGIMIPILSKDMPLPAMGYATFELADATQAGVTVVAVEDTGDGKLQVLGEFTFMLRRLTNKELMELTYGKRSVDIGMTMETSGKFICSIFDNMDPEHLRKRQKYQGAKEGSVSSLGYIKDEDSMPWSLLVSCIMLFVLYIASKVAFHEVEESAQIL